MYIQLMRATILKLERLDQPNRNRSHQIKVFIHRVQVIRKPRALFGQARRVPSYPPPFASRALSFAPTAQISPAALCRRTHGILDQLMRQYPGRRSPDRPSSKAYTVSDSTGQETDDLMVGHPPGQPSELDIRSLLPHFLHYISSSDRRGRLLRLPCPWADDIHRLWFPRVPLLVAPAT